MNWQDEMVPLVRTIIGDVVSPYTYSDTRLEETIVAAAQILKNILDFDYTYVMSLATTTITPDPVTNSDNAFINLVSLRAACFIYDSEAKAASRLGIRVNDGPSSIDISGRLSSALTLSKIAKADFEKAKLDFLAGNSRAGEAILTPYTNQNIYSNDNFA